MIRIVFDPELITGDWILKGATLDDTNEIVTAVAVALFTHRTARIDDALPDPRDTDRRGVWSDHEAQEIHGGWPVGSRLWLLSREKQTERTRQRAETYIEEAMQPFVDIELIDGFDLTVEWFEPEKLGAEIVLHRGPKGSIAVRFERLWDNFIAENA